jgi:predicted small lipoprotein YifL
MKKTILSFVVIVMALAIAACGSNNTPVVEPVDSTVVADTAVVDAPLVKEGAVNAEVDAVDSAAALK